MHWIDWMRCAGGGNFTKEATPPVQEPSLDGLEVRDPIFGKGLHLDWHPILEQMLSGSGVATDTIVSYYQTKDWGYASIFTPEQQIKITRYSKHSKSAEPLVCFNENLPLTGPEMRPMRILDVFESDHSITFLLGDPQTFLYLKMIDNASDFEESHLILSPAGVGQGSWVVERLSSQTSFGYFLPEMDQSFVNIQTYEFTSPNELLLGHGGPNATKIDFGGELISKNGESLRTEEGGYIFDPTLWPIEEVVRGIQETELPLSDDEKRIYREWFEGIEGGRKRVLREWKTKLKDHPNALKKLLEVDRDIFIETKEGE